MCNLRGVNPIFIEIKRCPKCGFHMLENIKWNSKGYSKLIYKCANHNCNYEEEKNE